MPITGTRLVHVKSVAHGANGLTDVESVEFQEGCTPLVLPACDNDAWAARVLATRRSARASVRLKDAASAIAAGLALNTAASLVAVGDDPAGSTATLTMTLANAVVMQRGGQFLSQLEGGWSLDFEAYSSDGTTAPLSFA